MASVMHHHLKHLSNLTTGTSHKHQPSSHFVFTCNQPHITSTSYMAMACMQSPTFLVLLQSPITMAPLCSFKGPCTGPIQFYMGHLNELQPTITNSQHNCQSPTLFPCYSITTMQFLTPILCITLHGSGETEISLCRLSLLYYLRAGTLTVWTVSIWDNPR